MYRAHLYYTIGLALDPLSAACKSLAIYAHVTEQYELQLLLLYGFVLQCFHIKAKVKFLSRST